MLLILNTTIRCNGNIDQILVRADRIIPHLLSNTTNTATIDGAARCGGYPLLTTLPYLLVLVVYHQAVVAVVLGKISELFAFTYSINARHICDAV